MSETTEQEPEPEQATPDSTALSLAAAACVIAILTTGAFVYANWLLIATVPKFEEAGIELPGITILAIKLSGYWVLTGLALLSVTLICGLVIATSGISPLGGLVMFGFLGMSALFPAALFVTARNLPLQVMGMPSSPPSRTPAGPGAAPGKGAPTGPEAAPGKGAPQGKPAEAQSQPR